MKSNLFNDLLMPLNIFDLNHFSFKAITYLFGRLNLLFLIRHFIYPTILRSIIIVCMSLNTVPLDSKAQRQTLNSLNKMY